MPLDFDKMADLRTNDTFRALISEVRKRKNLNDGT